MISAAQAREAADMFNDFMKAAGQNRDLRIQKVRHTVRAPEVEIFSRKLAAALQRAVPSATITVEETDAPGSGLNTFAAMAVESGLKLLNPQTSSPIDYFCLLQGSAIRVWASRFQATPAFAHSPVTVASGLGSGLGNLEIESAADSVFLQTFADVYAIAKIAATKGSSTAIKTLDFVAERRRDGGDFSLYALAPLSHDTRIGLELLAGRITMGLDFSEMTGEELIAEVTELTRTALRTWMESRGVDPKKAAQLNDNLGHVERQLLSAGVAPVVSSKAGAAAGSSTPGSPGGPGGPGARHH